MTASRWFGKLLPVFLVLSVGCSKEESREPVKSAEPQPAAPAAAPSPSAPATPAPNSSTPGQGVGAITGKVVFKGPHAPGKVAIGKDKEVCGDSKLDPALVVGSQGEVKNAVIQIAALKQALSAPKEAVFDQVQCEYVPHVLAIPVGSTVKIKNSDGILHNVHTFSEKNPPFNRAQPKYLKEFSEKFTKPEVISVRCDVHGWMSGWIVVTESPFYDVTAADGSFKMENVPVGKYPLDVWHETLGKTSQSVEVKSGEVTNVTFEFQMKK
jgi:plastocyanin